MAIFTLEMGYPLDNSRQTDNTSSFENGTALILDAVGNPPDFIHLYFLQF